MSELDRISALLTEAGQREGLDGLALGTNGTCGVDLSDDVGIQFEWVEENARLFIFSPLASLPLDGTLRHAVYGAIAEMNCLSPRRGVAAAHAPTFQTLYQMSLDTADLDANRICEALRALLDERPKALALIEKAIAQAKDAKASVKRSTPPSTARPERTWVEQLQLLEKQGARFVYHPCSEEDIAEAQAQCDRPLPAEYRRFLTHTGRGSDLLFIGEDIFFPALLSFQQQARGLILADEVRLTLPTNAFVFFIHRDIQFFFFKLNEGDDPPIYCYEEGADEFIRVYESFSEFMHVYIALHAESYDALTQFNRYGYVQGGAA
jgi:hypothetical protein